MNNEGMSSVQKNLLAKNTIVIQGKINGDTVFYVRDCCADLICRGSPEVLIMIFSGGGSVGAGLDVYDILKLYPGEKTAIVFGYARSMAAVILQACEKRYATRHAAIMIHHISSSDISLDTLRDKDRLVKFIASMEFEQEYLYKIFSEKTGKEVSVIREECAKDRDMPAEEALAFGLIDEIFTKPLPINLAENQ